MCPEPEVPAAAGAGEPEIAPLSRDLTSYPTGLLLPSPGSDATPAEPTDELEIRRCYRKAAAIHKQVRAYARELLVPGADMLDAANKIEGRLRALCGAEGYRTYKPDDPGYCAQAFPLGLSVNNCAAHYAPLIADNHVITTRDVVKVDFGVHCNGYLIDSAFTLAYDDKFQPILDASREAMNAAVKAAGVDVSIAELGNLIEEVISSYEFQGKHLCPVRNLTGHQVDQYQIHCGKAIPNHRGGRLRDYGRMSAGDVFACETFASTGKGHVSDEYPVSHYMVDPGALGLSKGFIKGSETSKRILDLLRTNFRTLAWCPRWLDGMGEKKYQLSLKQLSDSGYINPYPKLCDTRGSYVAQFEHTFMVSEWGKEVFSKGDDY